MENARPAWAARGRGPLVRIEAGRFTVRLAESEDDVAAAQRLRYKVFVEEMGAVATPEERAARREVDEFDPYFDHLLLIDEQCPSPDPMDRVAGVYRLMTGAMARSGRGFYGATEYDLSKLVAYPRETLELGRSCVDSEHRGGAGMHLLWTGLGQYVAERGVEIMFGVASFHGAEVEPLAVPLSWLHYNCLAPEDLRVRALPQVFQRMDLLPPDRVSKAEAMRKTPALIKAYLRLGGFVGEGAYVDHDFNTVDVCLLMDTARMVERYRAFYSREKRGATERILGE
jgi:L-ornithine Nalpha-acyltransferase